MDLYARSRWVEYAKAKVREETGRREQGEREGGRRCASISTLLSPSISSHLLQDAMFAATDTDESPWNVVPSDDKKAAQLNTITRKRERGGETRMLFFLGPGPRCGPAAAAASLRRANRRTRRSCCRGDFQPVPPIPFISSDLLSRFAPIGDVPYDPIELPPRQPAGDYVRPPQSEQRVVPQVFKPKKVGEEEK